MKRSTLTALLIPTLFIAAGCSDPQTAQAPAAPVQNSFTGYVERGATTMDRAQAATDAANARVAQQNAQAAAAAAAVNE